MTGWISRVLAALGSRRRKPEADGTMREVTVLQNKISALTDLLLKPPTPQFFDGLLPERTNAKLRDARLGIGFRNFVLIFVRQGCTGCASLLSQVRLAIGQGTLSPGQFACVIIGRPGGLDQALRQTGIPVITDDTRLLQEGCQVRQTPTLLHLDTNSLKVLSSTAGDDFAWITSRLTTDPLPLIPVSDVSVAGNEKA
jgi:hypothetical protein